MHMEYSIINAKLQLNMIAHNKLC